MTALRVESMVVNNNQRFEPQEPPINFNLKTFFRMHTASGHGARVKWHSEQKSLHDSYIVMNTFETFRYALTKWVSLNSDGARVNSFQK